MLAAFNPGIGVYDNEGKNVALEVNYDFSNGHTLTYLGTWRDTDRLSNQGDQDRSAIRQPLNIPVVRDSNLEAIQQELRISSPLGGPVDYIAGLSYQDQTFDDFNEQAECLGGGDRSIERPR